MRSLLDMPGVVPGCPSTPRNIPRPGSRAWVGRLTQRLVGGLFFLALLAAAPARAADLEWAPAAPLAGPGNDVSTYVLEREDHVGAWEQVVLVRHSVEDPHFDPVSGRFRVGLDVAGGGRWRIFAVDDHGNFSAPVHLQLQAVPAPALAAPTCTWVLPTCKVPVRCERACTCSEVSRRLDSARAELRAAGVLKRPELLDQALCLTTVDLVGPERLKTQHGQLAAGAAAEGSVLLASDMRAAAHEFFHLYLLAAGDRSDEAHQHDAWLKDRRLRDIDAKHDVGGWER